MIVSSCGGRGRRDHRSVLLRRLIVLGLLQLDRFVELAFTISTFGVE